MDKLFLYKLDEETGVITKHVFEEYEYGKWANNKKYYRIRFKSATYYCVESDLDIVKHWHIYTFNEDDIRAKEIFINFLNSKYKAYQEEANRFSNVMSKLLTN